jgi:hypothetical protein
MAHAPYRVVGSVGVITALLLSVVPGATAATATVIVEQRPDGAVSRLVYQASPGEQNFVRVGLETAPSMPPVFFLQSPEPTPLAPDCTKFASVDPYRPPSLRCPARDGTGVGGPRLKLGDGDDIGATSRAFDSTTAIYGGEGNDILHGRGLLRGGPGDDGLIGIHKSGTRFFGGPGSDDITSGRGADFIVPGPGDDFIQAGFGDDVVKSRDGMTDEIACGPGNDRVFLDGYDLPVDTSCNRVERVGAPRATPLVRPSHYGRFSVQVGCPIDFRRICRVIVTALSVDDPTLHGSTHMQIRAGNVAFANLWAYEKDGSARVTVVTLRNHRRPLRSRTRTMSYYADEPE